MRCGASAATGTTADRIGRAPAAVGPAAGRCQKRRRVAGSPANRICRVAAAHVGAADRRGRAPAAIMPAAAGRARTGGEGVE